MLALRIQHTFLDLYPKTAANITSSNPAFDSDHIERTFTYPFRIPKTPKNRNLLRHADRIDARNKQQLYIATLFLSGLPFETGYIRLTGGTDKDFQIAFESTTLQLLDELSTIKINEILEAYTIPLSINYNFRFQIEEGVNWSFLIDNHILNYNDLGSNEAGAAAHFVDEINARYPGFAQQFQSTQILLDMSLYPAVQIKYDELINISLVFGEPPPLQQQEQILAYVSGLNQQPIESHSFPVIHHLRFYGLENRAFQNVVNDEVGGVWSRNTPNVDPVWEHTIVPQVRLRYILDRIREKSSLVEITGNWLTPEIEQLSVFSNRALDEVVEGYFLEGLRYLNQLAARYDLNDHVPEMNALELLRRLAAIFKLEIRYQDQRLYLQKKVDQLRQPTIDWTALAEPTYKEKLPRLQGFELRYESLEQELFEQELFEDPFTPFGTGEQREEIPMRPLYETNFNFRVATTRSEGTSPDQGMHNPPGFRLFFDRGQQLTKNNEPYLQSGYSQLNSQDQVIGELSLDLETLYNQNYKDYVELADRPIYTKAVRLRPHHIIELRKWKNAKRKFFHHDGELIGFVKRVQFKVSPEGMSLAVVEIVKA